MNPILTKSYKAEAAVIACRIVKFGAADGQVVLSAAATDAHVGISEQVAADIGEQVDVIKSGLAYLELGGDVTRGGPITSDAVGRGVAAAPAAGANVRVVAFAEFSGVLGDIVPVLIAPHTMQG